jgi:hypothetical protein
MAIIEKRIVMAKWRHQWQWRSSNEKQRRRGGVKCNNVMAAKWRKKNNGEMKIMKWHES